jgi:hypothetical protein
LLPDENEHWGSIFSMVLPLVVNIMFAAGEKRPRDAGLGAIHDGALLKAY